MAMSGMAFGSWFAGFLYDHFAYYAPAFGTGVLFNLINLGLIGFLVLRTGGLRRRAVLGADRGVGALAAARGSLLVDGHPVSSLDVISRSMPTKLSTASVQAAGCS